MLTRELGNEQSEANAYRSEKGTLVLLGGQHEDGEDQHSCQEHLDEDSLRETCASTKSSGDVQISRKQSRSDSCRADGTQHLRYKDKPSS